MNNKFLLTTTLYILLAMPSFASNTTQASSENPDEMVAYLFT